MSSSDDEYTADEAMTGPAPASGVALQTSAKTSGSSSSGIIIGALAAGAVVAGGVCYKLLKSGKSKPAPSTAKKFASPSKKTVAKRAPSSTSAEPSSAAAATTAAPRQASTFSMPELQTQDMWLCGCSIN